AGIGATVGVSTATTHVRTAGVRASAIRIARRRRLLIGARATELFGCSRIAIRDYMAMRRIVLERAAAAALAISLSRIAITLSIGLSRVATSLPAGLA